MVKQFALMIVVWGIVGMLVGVIIAAQMTWPVLNLDLPWLHFGRLMPLHTNAVIFAFGGCALMGTSLYIVQRTCQTPLFSNGLAAFVFWGWQLVILSAAITLPLGLTTLKEYAELEWPIDILITVVWVAYAIVYFGTILKRKTRHIYVANWFSLHLLSLSRYCIYSTAWRFPSLRQNPIRSMQVASMRWSSGGMATMPWAFSASCITLYPNRQNALFTPTDCP